MKVFPFFVFTLVTGFNRTLLLSVKVQVIIQKNTAAMQRM